MADPDLEIRGGGGGGGGGRSPKNFFGPSVWSRNKGGEDGSPGPLPLDPPLT